MGVRRTAGGPPLPPSGREVIVAVDAKTLELRELVLKKYRYIDRK